MNKFFDNVSEAQRLKAIKYSKVGLSVFFSFFRYLLLIAVGFVILYPLLYMVITSIMDPQTFAKGIRVWVPTSFLVIPNYSMAWEALDYGRAFFNTFRFQIISALLEVIMCAIIGYGFARFEFKGKKLLVGMLFLTILIPDLMLLIPRAANFSNVDLLGIFGGIEKLVEWIASLFGKDIRASFDLTPDVMNTGFVLWLPSLFGVGLRSGVLIYIYIQFFTGLPHELEEAAWVDGAGPFKTFFRIAVPSSTVVFITVLVFSLIWHWNDTLLSGMYFTEHFTLSNTLASVEDYIGAQYGLYQGRMTPQQAAITMAACLMYLAPLLIFYMFIQRGFVESIDRVGITG